MERSWLKIILCLVFFLISLQKAVAATILVVNTTSNTVTLLDETTLNPVNELQVGYRPHEVSVTPNGKFALVTNFGDLLNIIAGSTLTVIDIANAKIVKTIQLPKRSRPHGMKFLSDSEVLVTAQGIQSLLLVNIETDMVLKTLSLPGAGAHTVTVDAEHRYAYVPNKVSGTLTKVDLKSWSVVGETKIGKQSEGVTLTPDENLALVTDSLDHYVAVIRAKDLVVLKTIPTGSGPVRITMADGGKSAIVINSISGTAEIIDLASFSVNKSFPSTISDVLLFAPANVIVRDDQTTAYISNFLANNIALVDFKQGVVLKIFKTASQPNGLAISPITATSSSISKGSVSF